ncbi:hypothetical protein EI94DRAFT_1836109 [Lactarius quietus]|nr:hypothetical protein EI94DRAFT_1836109 [Lactarius quietus]
MGSRNGWYTMLNAERIVDPVSGTVCYNGKHERAMFTCHPIEKPYLIFKSVLPTQTSLCRLRAWSWTMSQASSSTVAARSPSRPIRAWERLLTNPDLLCSILTALRRDLPARISVSAKIRLLPKQEDTLALVERIVNTGINCLTITAAHATCARASARSPRRDVAVIENGDCVGFEDARRIRALTGADSVMIATAAEANPTVFSPHPLTNLEDTFILPYLRSYCKYLDNHWASTKFCISQFKGRKSANKALRSAAIKAKSYADLDALVKDWQAATSSPPSKPHRRPRDRTAHPPPRVGRRHHLLAAASIAAATQVRRDCEHAPWVARKSRSRGHPRRSSAPHQRTPYPVPAGISKRDPGRRHLSLSRQGRNLHPRLMLPFRTVSLSEPTAFSHSVIAAMISLVQAPS